VRRRELISTWRIRLLVAVFVVANVAMVVQPKIAATSAEGGLLQTIRLLCGLPT
jgi:hypothetical protein